MKLLKLSSHGFAHHILLAVVVVGLAVTGTYFIVFGNANTCDVSSPVSGVVSQPVSGSYNCTPVSSAVSSPASSPSTPALDPTPTPAPVPTPTNPTPTPTPTVTPARAQVSCKIENLPATIKRNAIARPYIRLVNNGKTVATVRGNITKTYPNRGNTVTLPAFMANNLAPGKSSLRAISEFKVSKLGNTASSATIKASGYAVASKSTVKVAFNCSKTFNVRN